MISKKGRYFGRTRRYKKEIDTSIAEIVQMIIIIISTPSNNALTLYYYDSD